MASRLLIARPLAPAPQEEPGSRLWAMAIIGTYAIASLAYGFLSDAPWDDDCVVRYFHAREAWRDPTHFFSVWNRPLFMVLFAPAALLGREAMMVQMIGLSAWSGWLLYRALQRLGASHAHAVLPFFFFQAFYFTISRNFLTEPVAVAVICLGLHALVHQRYALFALMGGLLPLARLELVVILPLWAIALLHAKQWRSIGWMALPLAALMVLGYFVKDTTNPLWLVEDTLGKEGGNRYGHRDAWHYFQRFAYVTGPVVFFFLIVGLLERAATRRLDLFVVGQGIGILLLYVVFSTSLDTGNSAGFLRNLIPMTPFVALLAYDGLMAWYGRTRAATAAGEPTTSLARDERRRQKKAVATRPTAPVWWTLGRVHLFGLIAVAILLFFFSKQLEAHHKISETTDRTPALIGAVLWLVGLALAVRWRGAPAPHGLLAPLGAAVGAGALAFALWTERPDAHLNHERKAISVVSALYKNSYLRQWPLYANHAWFFWPSDLGYPDPQRYRTLNKAGLDAAPPNSVALWENHYANRLQGDLPLDDLYKRGDLVELMHVVSRDRRAVIGLFQKSDGTAGSNTRLRERFLREHPGNVHALHAIQLDLSRARRHEEALETARRMVAADSTYGEGRLAVGQALFDLQRYGDAAEAFRLALEHDTALHALHYSIALCHLRMSDHAGAVKALRPFLRRNRKSKEGHELLGVAYYHQQKYDSAGTAFDRCLQIDPRMVSAWMNRASTRLAQNRFDAALGDIESALRIEPGNRTALLSKAGILIRKGQRDAGCSLLRQLAAAGDAAAQQQLALCGR